MKISVDKTIFEKIPQYKVGVAFISGLDNSKGVETREPKIRDYAQNEIDTWDVAAKNLGLDTHMFPQANKNLSQRFVKDRTLPKVNPIVDIANVFSLETGAPVGLHDADKVSDIEIRPGRAGDHYQVLNQAKIENVVDPIVYASGQTVMTRNWTWRLSETSKADSRTKNAILFVDTLSLSFEETSKITRETAEEMVAKLGGKITSLAILDTNTPSVEFSSERNSKRQFDKIDELLERGVELIVPGKEELEKVLRSGKKLNIYNGIDPTGYKLHVGHAVPLRKLQQLLEMGHHVTFLIGDLTAFIGDTSDKNAERPQLSEEEIEANWQTYKKQASKFLDFSKIPVVRNTEWLNKLNITDVIKLTRHFSLNDFISRELIKKRLADGGSVSLAEVLYPIAQGYDSWHLKTDLQIGGPEQIFNMQAGRTLIKDFDGRESFCMSNAILEGTDGRKMSKSWGNAIWVEDPPEEMFGKTMSLRDELIIQYFTLATSISMEKVAEVEKRLKAGENPMVLKKELAHQIVSELHSKEAADKARENFEKTFQKGEIGEVEEIKAGSVEDLVSKEVVSSKSEWKRLVEQGAIELDGQKVTDNNAVTPGVYRIGKKKFIKVV